MRVIGRLGTDPVGCFFLIRRDLKDDTGRPIRVPTITLHRLTRHDAKRAARMLAQSASFAQGYDVVGLDSSCDCQGRATLEDPHADRCPCGIYRSACALHDYAGAE